MYTYEIKMQQSHASSKLHLVVVQICHLFWGLLQPHLIILLNNCSYRDSQKGLRLDKQLSLYSFVIHCEEIANTDLLHNCCTKNPRQFSALCLLKALLFLYYMLEGLGGTINIIG